jgi:mono/diheme cytochrome c family protein
MNPALSSLLGVLMLLFGATALGIMLELQGGRVTDEARQRRLRRIHRACGYCFVTIYLVLLTVMIWRIAGFREDLPPRALLHAGFALAMLPLIAIKILIIRRYPRLFPSVFPIAVTIFCLSFVYISLTAGYYYLKAGVGVYFSLASVDPSKIKTEQERFLAGKNLLIHRCSTCHTLERTFVRFKTEEGWRQTVASMRQLNPDITDQEGDLIAEYLTRTQALLAKGRTAKAVDIMTGKALFEVRCSGCHDIERVNSLRLARPEWEKLVKEMQQNAGETVLTDEDCEVIVNYLSTTRGT